MPYIMRDQHNRIVSFSNDYRCGLNDIHVDSMPEDFLSSDMADWKYSEQGGFVKDAQQIQTIPTTGQTICNQINNLNLTDEMLIQCILQLSQYVYGESKNDSTI